MSYRHPSGLSSSLSGCEFTAPSLHPFFCAWDADRELTMMHGSEAAGEQEWVEEFLATVLLQLTKERMQTVAEAQCVDLTVTQSQTNGAANAQSASASAAAGSSSVCTAQSASSSGEKHVESVAYKTILTQIDAILRHRAKDQHFPVEISVMDCLDLDPRMTSMLLSYPTRFLPLVDRALHLFQQRMYECPSNAALVAGDADTAEWIMKEHLHARLHELPLVEDRLWKRSLSALHSADVGHLVQLSGTVIRTGAVRMVESRREFECKKCQHKFQVFSDLDQGHALVPPTACPAPGRKPCRSTVFEQIEGSTVVRDYQRIKIQDGVMKLALGTLPRSIYCALHDDLVDRCHAGDEVEVVGIVRRLWTAPLQRDVQAHCELYIDASHVAIKHDRRALSSASSGGAASAQDEHVALFRNQWRQAALGAHELFSRNFIVSSFCPRLYGLFTVKLAVVLTIIGGVAHTSDSGTKVRGDCHCLLVGDAGTGKSQLLKYAAQVSPRSILTTGMGTTSAGLTVATVKEPGGEWVLEAGALVLASGGVCCIDEIGCMNPHDRSTMHEALEQQTVSVAKAGLVCTLHTRTTVIGAMNPKGRYDHDLDLSVNTSMATPLLSRFDLVLLLLDKQNKAWDERIAAYILDGLERPEEEEVQPLSREEFERDSCERRLTQRGADGSSGAAGGANGSSGAAGGANGAKENAPWTLEQMQAYIQYVRFHFFPLLTPLAQRMLSRYYQYQRAGDSRSAARTTIRLLESLVRLSQAHARLMWRHRATAQDAAMAILVVDSSSQSCSITSSTAGDGPTSLGTFASDVLQAANSSSPDDDYPAQVQALLRKLDLRPTPEEEAAEAHAEEENEKEILGEAAESEKRRQARMVREQRARIAPLFVAQQPGASLAAPARPTYPTRAEVHVMDTDLSVPLSFSSTSVGASSGLRSTGGGASASAGASASHIAAAPIMAAPAARRPMLAAASAPSFNTHAGLSSAVAGVRLSQTSQNVFYDPFSSATTHSAPIPALSSSQMARGTAAANVGAVPASRSSTGSVVSAASREPPSTLAQPAAKRPRLGRSMATGAGAGAASASSDSDDEDQSILCLTQTGPSRSALRSSQRAGMARQGKQQQGKAAGQSPRVKEEPADAHCMPAPAPRPRQQPQAPAPRQHVPASKQQTPQRQQQQQQQPQQPQQQPQRPPQPQESPLERLLHAGYSADMAQSILNNPLRAAAAGSDMPPTAVQAPVQQVQPVHQPAPLPRSPKQPVAQKPTPVQPHSPQQQRPRAQPQPQQQPQAPHPPVSTPSKPAVAPAHRSAAPSAVSPPARQQTSSAQPLPRPSPAVPKAAPANQFAKVASPAPSSFVQQRPQTVPLQSIQPAAAAAAAPPAVVVSPAKPIAATPAPRVAVPAPPVQQRTAPAPAPPAAHVAPPPPVPARPPSPPVPEWTLSPPSAPAQPSQTVPAALAVSQATLAATPAAPVSRAIVLPRSTFPSFSFTPSSTPFGSSPAAALLGRSSAIPVLGGAPPSSLGGSGTAPQTAAGAALLALLTQKSQMVVR